MAGHSNAFSLLHFWKSPSFWTSLVAILAYCGESGRGLNGQYVYDDAGTVCKNRVVNGELGWTEAFRRDYWGTELGEAKSHKSFRPITTLTFRANHILAQRLLKDYNIGVDRSKERDQRQARYPPTLSFHVVNVLLHGIVTALATKATIYVLDDLVSQFVVGFTFGLHPVHAEAVSNITSRGELLMSLFFFLAFLSYAQAREEDSQQRQPPQPESLSLSLPLSVLSRLRRFAAIYVLPWVCMTLSLLSKEQGATTLISLVLWDFLNVHGDTKSLFQALVAKSKSSTKEGHDERRRRDAMQLQETKEAWSFVSRSLVLAMQTLICVVFRLWQNGAITPDFIEEQNPAGFAKDRVIRTFSLSWVYCLYLRDAIYPYFLSCDWSGKSIKLISNWKNDPRTILVLALWCCVALSLWTMVVGGQRPSRSSAGSSTMETTLRKTNTAVWAFIFFPFFLSSNIFVVVGLMKGDRVIYLPLYGFCLLEAIVLKKLLHQGGEGIGASVRRGGVIYFLLAFQMVTFAGLTHDRNVAWSDSIKLWETAYAVNPQSEHTTYNYGYELYLAKRYEESERVLKPVGSARSGGPSSAYIYATVLHYLDRCDEAMVILTEAAEVVKEMQQEGGPRNEGASLRRHFSNILVAKARCTKDIPEKGRIFHKAAMMDRSNEVAHQLLSNYMETMERVKKMQNVMMN